MLCPNAFADRPILPAVFAIALLTACGGGAAVQGRQARSSGADGEAGASSELPDVASVRDVAPAMSGANSAVRGCAPGSQGELRVRATFASDGHLVSVELNDAQMNPTLDPSSRECVLETLGQIRLPPFRRSTMIVSFPYRMGAS